MRNMPKAHPDADKWLIWPAMALGGALGALLRYGWVTLFPVQDSAFPLAIFTENILGAFLLGWLLAYFIRQRGKHRFIRAFFGTGLIGSFTTFSGITLDLAGFIHNSSFFLPVLYSMVSMAAGLAAALIGLRFGRATQKRRKTNPFESG